MALSDLTSGNIKKPYYASQENAILTIQDTLANQYASTGDGYQEYEFLVNNARQSVISVFVNADKQFTIYTKSLLSSQEENEPYDYSVSGIYLLKKFGIRKGTETLDLGVFLLAQKSKEYNSYFTLLEDSKVVVFSGYPQSITYLATSNSGITKRRETLTPEMVDILKMDNAISRIVDEQGMYLRWLNPYGGWSYWLFECVKEETISTKTKGLVPKNKNTIYGIEHTFKHLGYTTKKQWKLKSAIPILGEEINILKGLLESSDIQLFKGEKNDPATGYGKWERVYIADGTYKNVLNKQDVFDFETTIIFNE